MIGAGSWGTTVAALAANRGDVTLWARRDELAETIAASGVNADYLPELQLPSALMATIRSDPCHRRGGPGCDGGPVTRIPHSLR